MPRLSPNLDALDRDNGQAGLIAPTGPGWAFGTLAGSSNAARYVRFVPSRSFTVASISFATTAFSAGDTADPAVDVGIYDSALNKIVTSGAATGKLNGAVGVKNVDITNTALVAGTTYYAALSCGALGTTTVTLVAALFGNAASARGFGSTAGLFEVESMAAAHVLPDDLTVAGTATSGYVLWLVEA